MYSWYQETLTDEYSYTDAKDKILSYFSHYTLMYRKNQGNYPECANDCWTRRERIISDVIGFCDVSHA